MIEEIQKDNFKIIWNGKQDKTNKKYIKI